MIFILFCPLLPYGQANSFIGDFPLVSQSSLNFSSESESESEFPFFNNIRRAATTLVYQVLHQRRRHAGQGELETCFTPYFSFIST
jgi:hypothetical protein